jgi:hypothetical protein
MTEGTNNLCSQGVYFFFKNYRPNCPVVLRDVQQCPIRQTARIYGVLRVQIASTNGSPYPRFTVAKKKKKRQIKEIKGP